MHKYLIVLSLFLPFFSFSQDLIVKSDQTRIFCKITKVDSAFITYRKPPAKSDFVISRKEVAEFRLARPLNATDKTTGNNEGSFREIVNFRFHVGSSNPVGDFGSQDLNSEKSGLAFPGRVLEAAFILKASKYVGILLNYRYQANPFNSDAIEKLLEAYYPGSIATCNAEDWKTRGLLAGLSFDLPITYIKNLSLTADLSAGMPQYFYPVMQSTLSRNNQQTIVTETSDPVRVLSYDIGLGLLYRVHPNIAFFGGCDFFSGKPEFSITAKNNHGYYLTDSYEQQVSTFNFKAGFCIILRQKYNSVH